MFNDYATAGVAITAAAAVAAASQLAGLLPGWPAGLVGTYVSDQTIRPEADDPRVGQDQSGTSASRFGRSRVKHVKSSKFSI